MKIKLNDIYTLNSDQHCVWITQMVRSKNGERYYERVLDGYHPNIQKCLLSYVEKGVNASEAQNLTELTSAIEMIKADIEEFCGSIEVDIRKIQTAKEAQ